MDIASLGPPVPAHADDRLPVSITGRGIISELSPLGEAIVQITVRRLHDDAKIALMLFVVPRTLQVVRATASYGGSTDRLDPLLLPGEITDIAASMTASAFPQPRRTDLDHLKLPAAYTEIVR